MADYSGYGMRIRSAIPMPGLPRLEPDPGARVDLTVEHGDVCGGPGPGNWYSLSPERSRLIWAGVGRFEIEAGNRIVFAADGAQPRFLVHVVLGPALGLLLQQRGLFPLHASVVEIDGEAVAIAGRSGAGKSTLAHELTLRGYRLVADDIAAIEMVDGVAWVRPGQTAHRLWPDSLQRAGLDPAMAELLHEQSDKRLLTTDVPAGRGADKSLPLSRVYVLSVGDGVSVTQLEGLDRTVALAAQVFYPELLLGTQGTNPVFAQCSAIARSAPVLRLERPDGDDSVEELADRVLSWRRS